MATIPRYQNLGVQYADLPRVSTAAQQARAQGFDQLSRSLDRMTSYFQSQAETKAKKEALKYAAENPLTQEQVDTALKTGKGVQVEGAGSVFQQTYEKAQGAMLASQLQLEGQRKLSNVAAAIEAGQPVDLNSIQADIKDMIDGYASTVMALDPEQSIKLRASLSTAGNALYSKAADRAVKVQQAEYSAYMDESLLQTKPLIEAIVAKAGTVDFQTGNLINIDQLIETQAKPYMDAIQITGTNKHYVEFQKIVKEAKIGALVAKLKDRDFSPDATAAIKNFRDNNFGNMTQVFGQLSEEDKAKVRNRVLESYADEQSAADLDQKAANRANKEKGNVLKQELLQDGTSAVRQRQITFELVSLDQITLPQAQAMLKDPDAKGNVDLYLNLNDQIARGMLTSIGDLAEYKSRLSKTEYKTLGTAITSTQGREAASLLKREAGIQDNVFAPADSKAKHKNLLSEYSVQLARKVTENGVDRYQTPVEAANAAIDTFSKSKRAEEITTAAMRARDRLEALLGSTALPELPLEQIDLVKLGLTGDKLARANKIIADYKRKMED